MIFVDSLCSNCDKAILEILNFNCISYKVTRSNNDLVTSMLFIVLTYTSVHTVHSSPDVGQNKIFENGLCGLDPLICI